MTGVGVFAGANRPNTDSASKPGSVAAIAGKPGAKGESCALVTAKPRSRPEFRCVLEVLRTNIVGLAVSSA